MLGILHKLPINCKFLVVFLLKHTNERIITACLALRQIRQNYCR